ncbi:hypothetical protein FJT64_009721 [Amphibalanus amphitrite]|uniref:Uncharacterized protein n=1 Tax=Amphibalanus amphitrite TaxID=1232801 RepID=A0A6A4VGI3_AMPAM|nr:hypothetical protein FJT64_009721 [Amphibalanus amphitrite]
MTNDDADADHAASVTAAERGVLTDAGRGHKDRGRIDVSVTNDRRAVCCDSSVGELWGCEQLQLQQLTG